MKAIASLCDERIHTAVAVKVDDRWFCGVGKSGRIQTAWSLAGAKLIIPTKHGLAEAAAIAYQVSAKRPRAIVEIKTLGAIADRPTAADAGGLSKAHAEQMQGARKAIAQLYQSAEDFMAIYDEGEAPDSAQEAALRDKMSDAFQWLIDDVQPCLAREKLLNPRPTANGAGSQKETKQC